MIQYLEQTLHRAIRSEPFTDVQKLPVAYRNAFDLTAVDLDGHRFLLVTPRSEMNLTALRKQQRLLERLTGYPCALCLSKMNTYAMGKMLEEGIPFIWKGHQVYLPFLGLLLNSNDGRIPKSCDRISFAAQRLLLTALYGSWKDVTVTQAARIMDVSKMTATRCYDEIQALELPFLDIRNRARRFSCIPDKKEMWEQLRPFLRSPVISEYRLRKDIQADYPKGGVSALEEYSLISENRYPVYAVPKKKFSESGITEKSLVPRGEEPACVLQKVGYFIPFGNEKAMDPLSVVLSLKSSEWSDPRVDISVKQMLKEYVW